MRPTVRSTATILCVDDEPDLLLSLGWFLSGQGFEVITAAGGAEALAHLQERLPDLIITDCVMPDISGLELCRHLRARPATARIPIILHTVLTPAADPRLYDRLVVKPADFQTFEREIRALLAAPH